MSKKKLYSIFAAIALVLVLGVAAYFMLRTKADASSALPADATAIGRVDLVRLAAGDNILRRELIRFLPNEDIRQTGIDISQQGYVFAYQNYFGAILPLKDERAFLQQLQIGQNQLSHERGMRWGRVMDNFLLCSDGDKALVLGPMAEMEMEQLRPVVYDWMHQTSAPTDNKLFAALEGRSAVLTLATSAAILPRQFAEKIFLAMPSDVKLDGSLLIADFQEQEKGVRVELELKDEDPRLKKYLDSLDKVLIPLRESHEMPAEDITFCATAGINGEKLLPLLRQNADLRTKLLGANMIADVDLMIKSIHGTLNIMQTSKGEHYLQTQLKDDGFMQNVSDWNTGASQSADVQFLPAKNNCYIMAYQKHVYYFGAREMRFFATNAERLAYRNTELKSVNGENKLLLNANMGALLGEAVSILPFKPTLRIGMKDVRHATVILGE